MKPADITRIRLQSQYIAGRGLATPAKLMSWMVAMQAQDLGMAKWAVGLRTVNGSLRQVDSALDAGILLRTHLMRPTWHLVHSDDVVWLLELTAPRVKAAMRLRNKQLGLTGALFAKTSRLLEKALEGHRYHTREELIALLNHAKIKVNENRAAHIFMQAELDGLICSGPAVHNVNTYALLCERVTGGRRYDREEGLSVLAARYFRSRGPATVHDFSWWSGLPAAEAKRGLAMVASRLACVTMDRYDYWFDPAFEAAPSIGTAAYLLPAFDEFLIAYRDRTAVLADGHRSKMISSNGIFWPAVVVGGLVAGKWRRSRQENGLLVEAELFGPVAAKRAITGKAGEFGKFLGAGHTTLTLTGGKKKVNSKQS